MPTPATYTSLVGSVFDRAVLICLLAVSVGRNLVKLSLLFLLLSVASGYTVLIRTQFSSFWGRGIILIIGGLIVGATSVYGFGGRIVVAWFSI